MSQQTQSYARSIPSRRRRARNVRQRRRGAAALEFALTAIPLFLFIFGSIEFGRALMSVQSLEEAARAGCRVAILDGSTTSDVESEVQEVMQMAGIATYTVTVDPTNPTTAAQWDPVTVNISAAFADMCWLPLPRFFLNKSFSASCTMPHEGGES